LVAKPKLAFDRTCSGYNTPTFDQRGERGPLTPLWRAPEDCNRALDPGYQPHDPLLPSTPGLLHWARLSATR
jgi:hypothetical protein